MSFNTISAAVIQFYGIIFAILIVVVTLGLNRKEPTVPKMVFGVVISIILTAIVFMFFNPAYTYNVFFSLVVGLAGLGLVAMSKSPWSFAAAVVVAIAGLAIYMAWSNPGHALILGISLVVAIGILGVVIHGMNKGYTFRKGQKVKIALDDGKGHKLIASGNTGSLLAAPGYEEKVTTALLADVVRCALTLYPNNHREQAEFLLEQGQTPAQLTAHVAPATIKIMNEMIEEKANQGWH